MLIYSSNSVVGIRDHTTILDYFQTVLNDAINLPVVEFCQKTIILFFRTQYFISPIFHHANYGLKRSGVRLNPDFLIDSLCLYNI